MRDRRMQAARAVFLGAALLGEAAGAQELALLEAGQDLGFAAVGQRAVAASPNGAHVYAAAEDFLFAFRRQPDGRLAHLPPAIQLAVIDPLFSPQWIAVGPSGANVYVAGFVGTVGVFTRDAQSGAITTLEDEDEQLGGSSSALAVSPDGTRVYVTSPGTNALVAYAAAQNGALSLPQRLVEGQDGVTGLAGAARVAVSPDGFHVYVGGTTGGAAAIAVFRRANGSLAFVEREREGEAGVTGLGDVSSLAVAPDGAEVLALSQTTGEILRFARDVGGALSFTSATSIAAELGTFVFSAGWLALRPDGRRLYTGTLVPAATLVFSRDVSGGLHYLDQAAGSGFAGIASPDGRHVYTTGGLPVRVYAPEPGAVCSALAAGFALLQLARRRAA